MTDFVFNISQILSETALASTNLLKKIGHLDGLRFIQQLLRKT